ncbi:MAG: hypothetical protein EBS42_13605 [Caulobacteraceae bacterium]|nr:hypothetical protein [Caulobacteraceae bacterium]
MLISGQTDLKDARWIEENTGRLPVILALDFMRTPARMGRQVADTDTAIDWFKNKGGIVSYQWHWSSPTGASDPESGFYAKSTTFDLQKALADPKSPEYLGLIADIDDVAVELKRMNKAGVPITYSLAEARRKGPVVVYFFPAAFTGGCDLEAHLFAEAADDYAKAGATIIGVTAGSLERLAEFSADNQRCSGKFPVAADPGAKIAKLWKSTLPTGISNRTSFVVAPNGQVLFVHSDLNPREHVALTLAAVRKFKGG